MNIQRLRNLTTGKMHTKIDDIYEDIEFFTGEKGVMTHMLPNAREAMLPYLKENLPDERYWNNEYDPKHIGDVFVACDEQRRSF